MEKKKIFMILISFLTLSILSNAYFMYNNYYLKKEVLSYKENIKINKNNMLSMMLETDMNSKTYIQSTDNKWPTDGYVFNEQMSECEQGSILKWDDANKKVIMEGNVSDKCYVFFDKYNPIKINSYTITPNGKKITISISATSGTGTIAKYFYSKDDGASYVESTSNTYTFTNLANGTYKIKAYVLDSNNKISEFITKNIEITSMRLSEYIMSQYTGTQGENNIYYHDSRLSHGAKDNSYRYAGASADVKNYICIGSSATTCPTDNLYRIIGVFGDNNHGVSGQQLVKVIKNTTYGKLAWNTSNSNDWASATLNKTINTSFITEKLYEIENKIATVTWKVSGYDNANSTVNTLYTAEITNTTKTHTAKIGLMYVSDYGYATIPDYWTTNLYNYSSAAKNKDWLCLGSTEWLVSPFTFKSGSKLSASAWIVNSSGYVSGSINLTDTFEVRPSFYLLSSVNYIGGDGTKNSPIRIN